MIYGSGTGGSLIKIGSMIDCPTRRTGPACGCVDQEPFPISTLIARSRKWPIVLVSHGFDVKITQRILKNYGHYLFDVLFRSNGNWLCFKPTDHPIEYISEKRHADRKRDKAIQALNSQCKRVIFLLFISYAQDAENVKFKMKRKRSNLCSSELAIKYDEYPGYSMYLIMKEGERKEEQLFRSVGQT